MFGEMRPTLTNSPELPPGCVVYAVGDIHGRADLLLEMFYRLERDRLENDFHTPLLIFLGDYVDRGPDSRTVIDLLQRGRPEAFQARFLMGNHEQAMLAFMHDPLRNRSWLRHGGAETLISYGVKPCVERDAQSEIERASAELKRAMPIEHWAFLQMLERYVSMGEYIFVHAGIDPKKPLEAQSDRDLFWIRDAFLNDRRPLDRCVVHGHTPTAEPYKDARRICIDTGAFSTGMLTAVRLRARGVSFLSVRGERASDF